VFQKHCASLGVIESHRAAFPVGDGLAGVPVDGETLSFDDAVDENTPDGMQDTIQQGLKWICSPFLGNA
jgi:hypothetical protein